jgi:hypothetical protein
MKATRMFALTVSSVLAMSGAAQAYFHQGWSDGSTKILKDPTDGVSLLKGFDFNFDSGVFDRDHNVQRMGVLSDSPSPDKTFIQFRDKKADDDYEYFVELHPIDGAGVQLGRVIIDSSANDTRCRSRGTCEVAITRPSPSHVFVLRGFLARYLNGDHQLRRIAVTEDNNVVTVHFHDRNSDDAMSFEVEYAWLPASLVQQAGEVSGEGKSFAVNTLPAGLRVISGFDLHYKSDDHDMYMFGITGNDQGNLRLAFADYGGQPYTYRVKYAILR